MGPMSTEEALPVAMLAGHAFGVPQVAPYEQMRLVLCAPMRTPCVVLRRCLLSPYQWPAALRCRL